MNLETWGKAGNFFLFELFVNIVALGVQNAPLVVSQHSIVKYPLKSDFHYILIFP